MLNMLHIHNIAQHLDKIHKYSENNDTPVEIMQAKWFTKFTFERSHTGNCSLSWMQVHPYDSTTLSKTRGMAVRFCKINRQ